MQERERERELEKGYQERKGRQNKRKEERRGIKAR